MNRTVYFADRAVAFTAEAPGGAWYAVAAEACGGISRAKILNFLESHNSVAVVSDDPDRAFAAFAAEFTPVAWRLGSCGRCARRCTPTIFRKLRAGN